MSYSSDSGIVRHRQDTGGVVAITAPDGKTTRFEYDALGRTTAQIRPDDSTVRFTYDLAGNMTTLVTPRDATHTFDANSKGARTSYATPLSGTYAYAYDVARRLDTVTTPAGLIIDYDYEHDFLTSVTAGDGGLACSNTSCVIRRITAYCV